MFCIICDYWIRLLVYFVQNCRTCFRRFYWFWDLLYLSTRFLVYRILTIPIYIQTKSSKETFAWIYVLRTITFIHFLGWLNIESNFKGTQRNKQNFKLYTLLVKVYPIRNIDSFNDTSIDSLYYTLVYLIILLNRVEWSCGSIRMWLIHCLGVTKGVWKCIHAM